MTPLVHDNLPTSIAWAIFAIVMANMLVYVVSFSDPILVADGWYFLDAFLSKALDGTLQFGDLFIKRNSLDHAQPLRKLILLFELRHYDLDFRIQAVIGLVCAGGSLLLLRYLVFWNNQAHRNIRSWIWAAMCVALVSLNSTGVWTWPLVAEGFTSYIFVFALLVSTWKYIDSGSGWIALLVICALALDFVADKVAILATIACIIALIFAFAKISSLRRRTIYAIITLIACLIIVRISYAMLYSAPPGSTIEFGTRLDSLLSDFINGGWWQWILVPLGSSVAYIQPLKHLVGNSAGEVQAGIGIVLLACHVWFWWQAFRTKPNAAHFSAIAMMLFFYALLAGILYTRMPTFGNNYLNQPRYVLIYGMGNIALLLMCASHPEKKTILPDRKVVVALMATALLLWQIPVSRIAWRAGPYISAYEQKLADQLWTMADNGYKVPPNCRPELFVCQYPQKKRARLIKMLQSNKLNVFSKRFQRDTKIYPPKSATKATAKPLPGHKPRG